MSNHCSMKIKFEPMHAVSNAPYLAAKDQKRGNFNEYRAARIENGKVTIFAEINSIFYIEV